MWSLSKASSKIAFGSSGSGTPFQSRWVVSWPAATEPSLAVKSIVVVKVALPFVSF
jgi:Tol biopolymer transport system component